MKVCYSEIHINLSQPKTKMFLFCQESKNMSQAQLQAGPLPPPLTLHPVHLPFPPCSNTPPTKRIIWQLLLGNREFIWEIGFLQYLGNSFSLCCKTFFLLLSLQYLKNCDLITGLTFDNFCSVVKIIRHKRMSNT